jgi:hypothetical protein
VTDPSSLHGLFAGDKWNIATTDTGAQCPTENAVAGWGGYQKPKKSKQQLDLERRRELGMKFPSDTAELQAIAAKCRRKPKRLPPAPYPDDIITESAPSVVGPCQLHVASTKARRTGKAVQDDEPHVDERQTKLEASRAYHRARYKAKKAKQSR